MKKSELKEIIQESLFEVLTEALCAKGKAYVAKRKAAGEKHGAYLMGRAVKVCKGQIKGEDVDEAMYGTAIHDAPKKKVKKEDAAMKKSALGMAMYGKKSKMDEDIEVKDGTEFKIKLKHLLQKHATNLKKGPSDTEFKLTLKHLLDKHVSKGGEEKDV